MNVNRLFKSIFIAVYAVTIVACGPVKATVSTDAAPALTPLARSAGTLLAEGRLEPVRYTDLSLNATGLVSEVLAKEGDALTAGQVIARVESSQAKTLPSAQADALQALTAAYQAVRDSQYNLDQFDVPYDFKGMTPQQAVDVMLAKLNAARDAFEPYKWMSEKQLRLTTAEQEDRAIIGNTAKRMKKQLDDAWGDYRNAVKWLDLNSALTSAQAQLVQAQKDYDSLQDPALAENTAGARAALANAELRAPFAGTLTNLDLKVGQFAPSGQPVATLADFSSWVVKTTDLTEIDVVNVKEGQPVTLTLDAIPGVTLKGYVLSIGQNYSEKQGDIVYEVKVLLTDRQPAMRWGMTAEVNFSR